MSSESHPRSEVAEASEGVSRDLWLLGLLSAAFFLVALGGRDLWNPNEPIYGRAVAEMWERGEWLLPTVNDQIFAEKPILYYWLALAAATLFGGVSEFVLRMPSVLAGVTSVVVTYLLVLPYAGRGRAKLASAILASQYLVWWSATSVQMDVLVLASSVAVLLPLSRMLDFGMTQTKAWGLAGIAAGLGFAAKGPVAWIVPGITFFAYVALRRIPPQRWAKGLPWGAAAAVALAAPWYLLLWTGGNEDALREVLLRQNFSRFVEAWDHDKPWYYYLLYLWVDYFPWSWFLPLAIRLKSRNADEGRLHLLAWAWLVGTLLFFSLADSKRAPYILPMAPAIAILVSSVLDRLGRGELSEARRRACLVIAGFIGSILVALGAAILLLRTRLPEDLVNGGSLPTEMLQPATFTAVGAALGGATIYLALWRFRQIPKALPAAIAIAMATLYLVASTTVLPAANGMKSARAWAQRLEAFVGPDDQLVSYGFRRWRAGYPYYAGRSIRNYLTHEELTHFWENEKGYLLVEDNAVEEVRGLLGDVSPVMTHSFSKRIAYLFSNIEEEDE